MNTPRYIVCPSTLFYVTVGFSTNNIKDFFNTADINFLSCYKLTDRYRPLHECREKIWYTLIDPKTWECSSTHHPNGLTKEYILSFCKRFDTRDEFLKFITYKLL